MPKYSVEVEWVTKEVATAHIEIEAESEAEACARAELIAHHIDGWGKAEIIESEFAAVGANHTGYWADHT